MCHKARDRPSQNACDDTFSMIGKGPQEVMVELLQGRVVLMFRESSQTVALTLNGGIGRRCNAEWTLILFEGTRYLVI